MLTHMYSSFNEGAIQGKVVGEFLHWGGGVGDGGGGLGQPTWGEVALLYKKKNIFQSFVFTSSSLLKWKNFK